MTVDSHLRLSIAPRWIWALAALGAAGLLGGLLSGWLQGDDLAHFYHTYLATYSFFLSLALGALFFVLLQHVTHAGWSVSVRRLAEILAGTLPALAVLFLPIAAAVIGRSPVLYEWADPQAVQADELLLHKQPYLNAPFFALRTVIYFAVWVFLARYYLKRSLAQDDSQEPQLTLAMERASPLGLLLFAATVTFASFDWLMSLEPRWFSTIFGVYYFSGAVLGALAAMILMAVALQARGYLRDSIQTEHYHDLGKLLFAFVVFWGYIAFSQYLLMWYANLPEETVWYLPRIQGPWGVVSVALLLGHLLIPFLGLLPRTAKRRKPVLAFWAAWLLAIHWLDLYWLVMPSLDPGRIVFGLTDILCLVGQGCLMAAAAASLARGRSLLAVGDPRLGESLAFENL